MKTLLISSIILIIMGCSQKNPSYSKINDARSDGDGLIQDMHEQGYYNCLNSGGDNSYCSKLHNYRK